MYNSLLMYREKTNISIHFNHKVFSGGGEGAEIAMRLEAEIICLLSIHVFLFQFLGFIHSEIVSNSEIFCTNFQF